MDQPNVCHWHYIEHVYIAVWSDQEYPYKKEQILEENQRKLAKTRLDNLRNHFAETFPDIEIRSFNMAEHSGFWSNLFGTKDADLKEAVANKDGADVETELQAIAEQAKPSVAVMSVKVKDTSWRTSGLPGTSRDDANEDKDDKPKTSPAE